MQRFIIALLALGSLATTGCSDQEFHSVAAPPQMGELTLQGRVCDPVRKTWLPDATVYTNLFDSDGHLFGTTQSITDEEGRWLLDRLAPELTYKIYVQYGTEVLEIFEVTMESDDMVLPEPNCAASSTSKVAVITGDYDHFDELLPQVGIESFELINGKTGDELVQFLSNLDGLMGYDAIFFPGGHLEEDVVYDVDGTDTEYKHLEVQDALRGYVQAGGVIIASDWSYDVVERIWPNHVDFLGDALVPDTAQDGVEASVLSSVSSSDLESSIGTNQVPISFDLDQWPVMEGVGADTEVLMTATVPYRVGQETFTLSGVPILVGFDDGDGKVFFSSWRQSTNNENDALSVIRYMVDHI
jgi:hypothetical protein